MSAIHPNAFLPGERLLLEANGGILTLTSHRVRLAQGGRGDRKIISIALNSVASCSLVTVSYPAVLGLGVVAGLLGIGFIPSAEPGVGLLFLFAALVCVLAYLIGRRAILEVASAGATIQVEAKRMDPALLMTFIDTLERAKLAR